MRRLLSAFALLGLLTASAALAVPASAAPALAAAPSVSATSTCDTYPVGTCQAQILASTTCPTQGQTIEVAGLNYLPNENVALTIGGISVGTAHTDANGSFDPPVVVPALTGNQPLKGTGASGQPTDVDSLMMTIGSGCVAGSSSSSDGGLASTGVQIAAFSAVGAALIIAGIAFAVFGRRRRSAHGS